MKGLAGLGRFLNHDAGTSDGRKVDQSQRGLGLVTG
jgi:hypothetical protein